MLGLTGVKVLWTMVERHIQLLKAHTHPLYQYADAGYSTREMVDELDANELMLQVVGLISSIVSVRIVSTPRGVLGSRPS